MRARVVPLALVSLLACDSTPKAQAPKPAAPAPVKPVAELEIDPANADREDPTRRAGVIEDADGMAIRKKSLARLDAAGFQVASSLPTLAQRSAVPAKLRSAEDVAKRVMALNLLFIWAADSEHAVTTKDIQELLASQKLRDHLTPAELAIMDMDRAAARERHIDAIGWRLENIWPLTWALGHGAEPPFDGAMIDGKIIEELVFDFLPTNAADGAAFLAAATLRPEAEIVALEDLFYCAHNAVRSAQTGEVDTVPKGFHPATNGGVIHERRHALTWAISAGVSWDETDLST